MSAQSRASGQQISCEALSPWPVWASTTLPGQGEQGDLVRLREDEFENALPGDCALGRVLGPRGKFHLLISLLRVLILRPERIDDYDDADADAAADAAAAAAHVGDYPCLPWTASKVETRLETPNLMAHDPSTPVPDATHAPGSRYGA